MLHHLYVIRFLFDFLLNKIIIASDFVLYSFLF